MNNNNKHVIKKTFIYVLPSNKEDAIKHGAFYHSICKSWYIPNGDENEHYNYLMKKYGTIPR